jgi:glycine oxidase
MHYIIIGNGIIANTIAFRLLQRISATDEISIIGPSERPSSATLAAGAMLNSFAEFDETSLKTDADLYHFELSHEATRMWPDFERELIDACGEYLPEGCSKCQILQGGGCYGVGTFVINNASSDDADDRNFDAIVKALKDFNEQFEFVSPTDIPNYAPSQRKRAIRALYIHNEGWLNPHLVMEKLDVILLNDHRVNIVDAYAERLIHHNGVIKKVGLQNGEIIEGDTFLLATGASVSETLEKSELDINVQKVFYGVGISLEIKAPGLNHTHCIRTPIRGGACGIYSVPYFWEPKQENDHILIGASNMISHKPVYHGRISSIQHLLQSAIEEINGNFYAAELIRTNVGARPITQDTYPLMGQTSLSNLFISTGTKRDGFHLSPLISDILAKQMIGEAVDEQFLMFSPERELLHRFDRETAVTTIVSGLMSEQFQHNYNPSNIRMNKRVIDAYRKDIESLHDKVGAVDWGIPPEMVKMYREGHTK